MLPFACYEESAAAIRAKMGDFQPKVLLILGSGLGFLGDEVENAIAIDYGDIPHFKVSTAPDHKGRLVLGKLSGVNVMVMQGRMHYYEGYKTDEIAQMLDEKPSTVRNRLRDARGMLRKTLGGEA